MSGVRLLSQALQVFTIITVHSTMYTFFVVSGVYLHVLLVVYSATVNVWIKSAHLNSFFLVHEGRTLVLNNISVK